MRRHPQRGDASSRSPLAAAAGGRGTRAADQRGFTLLELLVVMALIGVLTGMGVGFLQRKGDDFAVALSTLRDQLRIAALTARSRHLPAEVVVEPAGDQGPAMVRARVLEPVGNWPLDDDRGGGRSASLVATVDGELVPGRFGMGRRPEVGSRSAVLHVATGGRPVFDLRDGFAFRVDVKPEAREQAVVLRLKTAVGPALELRLDDELTPSAKLLMTEGGGQAGPSVTVAGTRALAERWHTLEVVHDGRELWLLVDGAEVDRAAAGLPMLQSDSDVFEVSPADLPFVGIVDEVRVLAYSLAAGQTLPAGVVIDARPAVIGFDADGDLFAPATFALSIDDDRRTFHVGPGGVVE